MVVESTRFAVFEADFSGSNMEKLLKEFSYRAAGIPASLIAELTPICAGANSR